MNKRIIALLFLVLLASPVLAERMQLYQKSWIQPDEMYLVQVNKSNVAVSRFYFSVKKPVRSANITIQRITNASAPAPLNYSYGFFRLFPEGMDNDDIEKVEIEFRVHERWVEDYAPEPDFLKLNIYNIRGKWETIPAVYTGMLNGYAYFKSTTDRLGYFAVSAHYPVVIEQPEVYIPQQPIVRQAPPAIPWYRKIPKMVYILAVTLLVIGAILYTIFSIMYDLRHPYPELTKYVEDCIGKGASLEEIRKILINAGWPRNLVDKELINHGLSNAKA